MKRLLPCIIMLAGTFTGSGVWAEEKTVEKQAVEKLEGDVSVPRPVVPQNGAYTGKELRPEFRWTGEYSGEVYFELQVDDSCSGTVNCKFASPEIRVSGLRNLYFKPPRTGARGLAARGVNSRRMRSVGGGNYDGHGRTGGSGAGKIRACGSRAGRSG
jgi:hypothetical protein